MFGLVRALGRAAAIVSGVVAIGWAAGASAAPLAEFVIYKAEGGPCVGLCQPGANISGATLSALLYQPAKPSHTAVLLIPQGTGGFTDGLHDYGPLAQHLMDAGYGLMIANMRTAGKDGWFYDRFESTLPDVTAAANTLKARGYTNIILLGTSFGGPRATYYWMKTHDPAVKGLVFMASITSPYLEGKVRQSPQKREKFEAFLEKARALVRDGKGTQPVCFNYFSPATDECEPGGPGNTLSAASFLSMFGAPKDTDANITNYADQVTIPVVIVHSVNDEVSHPPVAQSIYDSLTHAPKREIVWIKDQNVSHYLTPGVAARRYAEEVSAWLSKNIPAK